MKTIEQLKFEIVQLKAKIELLENADKSNAEDHAKILALLVPMADNYKLAGLFGKWVMAICTFAAIILGIILSWSKIVGLFNKE